MEADLGAAVLDALADPVVVVDNQGSVRYANLAVRTRLGWSAGDLRGRPVSRLVPGWALGTDASSGPVAGVAACGDGTEIDVELSVTRTTAGGTAEPLAVLVIRVCCPAAPSGASGAVPARLLPVLAAASGLEDGPELLRALAESMGWDLAMLWVVDRGAGRLRLQAVWPAPDHDAGRLAGVSRRHALAPGDGLPGLVWAGVAPVWAPDVASQTAFPRAAAAAADGLVSAFAFPVTNGGRFVGVVELWSRRSRPEEPEVVAAMAPVGAGLGQLLERWQAEAGQVLLHERLAFLAEATEILATSLDLDETMGRLARLIVPQLADWCTVHILAPDGQLVPVVIEHVDPARVALVREVQERYLAPDGTGVRAVARTGEPTFYDVITDDALVAAAVDEDHLALLRSLDLASALLLPLTAHGRRLGTLSLATEGGRPITAADRSLAEELARRAAQAIDNSRLYREMQQATEALRFQAALLTTQAEAGIDGMLVVSPAGEMLSFNQRFVEMWRIDEAVLDSRSDDQALALATQQVVDPEAFLARVRQIYADPVRPVREEIAFQDGRVFDRYGAPLRADDGSYLGWAWYFRDITERKRDEQRLLESGERFASLARTLQESLLPPDLPEVPGVQLAARYHPAGTGLEVGGDFYDVFRIGRGSWGVVMGDVCGKGAAAASLTALARYTLRAAAMQTNDPARVLGTLNQAMLRQTVVGEAQDERFATVVYAAARRARERLVVTVACGGHAPPLLVRPDGSVLPVGQPGTLLGLFRTVELENAEVELRSGDALVLFTDGVTEAPGPGGQLGEQALVEVLRRCAGRGAAEMAATVERVAMEHQGGVSRDDMAVLVLGVPPA